LTKLIPRPFKGRGLGEGMVETKNGHKKLFTIEIAENAEKTLKIFSIISLRLCGFA